jgi:hypothetical protein
VKASQKQRETSKDKREEREERETTHKDSYFTTIITNPIFIINERIIRMKTMPMNFRGITIKTCCKIT